jgi:methylmalonyl-CoA mutase C-terminal domain/subunit
MGGILPPWDIEKVKEAGVGEVFGPGSPTTAIIDYVRKWDSAR